MSKLPFEITDKVKADFQATLDFWEKEKNADRIKKIANAETAMDAFCLYFKSCHKCPISQNLKQCLGSENDMYKIWLKSIKLKDRKNNAEKIYKFIKSWCDKNIFNQEGAE